MDMKKFVTQKMENVVIVSEVLLKVLKTLTEDDEFIVKRPNTQGYWIKSTKTGKSYTINFWEGSRFSDDPDDIGISCSMDACQNHENFKINNLYNKVIAWVDRMEESGV